MRQTSPTEDLVKGIWRENPVLVQMLGLCPTLAVTNSVANGIAMGLATFFVLLGSSILVSTVRKVIPKEVRITAYILIIATFVTIVDFMLAAIVPDIHKALGAFIALIVVNCIILGRQEAFSSRNTVARSAIDAIGNGVGFIIVLLLISGFREVLGNGTFLGFSLFGPNYEPWVIMILPPGGFFTLGMLLIGLSWWKQRKVQKPQPRRWINQVVPEPALAVQGALPPGVSARAQHHKGAGPEPVLGGAER